MKRYRPVVPRDGSVIDASVTLSLHEVKRVGDRFVCAVCAVRWPCIAKHLEVIGRIDEVAKVAAADVRICRSCGQEIYWGVTAAGKNCPYDIVDGKTTEVSHFKTCTDPDRWSKKK